MLRLFAILLLLLMSVASADASGLDDAFAQSAAGMRVQGERMKIISENIANSESTGNTSAAEPYRRKTITFENKFDKKQGTNIVAVKNTGKDYKSPFEARFDPGHPAADEKGYVLLPNVKTSIEMLDMKESQRTYEANLGAIETTKRMYNNTLDLLR